MSLGCCIDPTSASLGLHCDFIPNPQRKIEESLPSNGRLKIGADKWKTETPAHDSGAESGFTHPRRAHEQTSRDDCAPPDFGFERPSHLLLNADFYYGRWDRLIHWCWGWPYQNFAWRCCDPCRSLRKTHPWTLLNDMWTLGCPDGCFYPPDLHMQHLIPMFCPVTQESTNGVPCQNGAVKPLTQSLARSAMRTEGTTRDWPSDHIPLMERQ